MPDSAQKPDSLYQLLLLMQQIDDLSEAIDLSAQTALMDGAKIKVDSYKYLIDKLEAQEFYLASREKEYASAKKTIQSNIKRIKEHLVFALSANGFEKFTGNECSVTLQKSKGSVHLKMGDPDVYKAINYGEFVRTDYSWDKTAISKALSSNDPRAKEIAEIKITEFPKFSVLKEGIK